MARLLAIVTESNRGCAFVCFMAQIPTFIACLFKSCGEGNRLLQWLEPGLKRWLILQTLDFRLVNGYWLCLYCVARI